MAKVRNEGGSRDGRWWCQLKSVASACYIGECVLSWTDSGAPVVFFMDLMDLSGRDGLTSNCRGQLEEELNSGE